MIVIKLAGAAVFVAALLVGAGVLFSVPTLYYVALVLAAVAFITVILSALPWRRRRPKYP